MSEQKPVIAVFDFDGTITYADSFLPFLRQCAGFMGFWFRMVLLFPVLVFQSIGMMPNDRAKARVLKSFIRDRDREWMEDRTVAFMPRLTRLLNPIAMERLNWHRDEGHRLILLSASPENYLQRWAIAEGFESVLATRLEEEDGSYTGSIDGANCHGAEKVVRLKAELGDLSQYEIYSYGDSKSDKILLNLIDHSAYRSFEGGSRLSYKIGALARFLRALI
ncbi:MAG: HAD-IB family hydrolase [Limisphaerales bacterium]